MRRWLFVVGVCAFTATPALGRRAEAEHNARPSRSKKPPNAAQGRRAQAPPPSPARAADVARLGRGYHLYEQDDFAAATRELRPLAEAHLLNQDYALYLLAQSEAMAGHREAALRHFRALVTQHKRSRFAALAQARAADLAFELGHWDEASQGYRATLHNAPPEIELAVVRYRLAEIAARGNRLGEAKAGFREVFVEHPEHPLADRALDRLRGMDPATVVMPTDRVERARRLSTSRFWQRAIDELALVPADAPPPVRDEADYWIGTTHFRMRHGYEIAATKLAAVADRLDRNRQTEALFHAARAWSRVDQDDRAIAGYKVLVERFPHARQAPEASFLMGWLEYNRGAFAAAIPGLTSTLEHYGDSAFADDAHWYLGFSKWLLGDTAGALTEFDWLARRRGAYDGGKGRYWKGRALDQLHRPEEAVAVWRDLVTDYPLSYYGIQARLRLREHGVLVGPFGDGPGRATVTPLGEVDPRLASDPVVARIDELLKSGMKTAAGAELDREDGDLIKRLGAARALPLLLDRYRQAENFHRVHRLGETYAGAALRTDPHGVPAARGWWEAIYPRAYQAFIEKYGPTGNNPTYYLYTIMQKESAYDPHDVSYADAIGLLQMIPPTSRRVGERIGRPYTDDVLYDPEGNIQFGAWYIGHLLEKFKGQVPLGAGSFNAGPRAMIRWLKLHGALPLDEFIERCAYTQTREYMKKVVDIYAHYVYLYEKEEYLPDLKIDAAYLENDIDY